MLKILFIYLLALPSARAAEGWIQCTDRKNLEANKADFDYATEVEAGLKKAFPSAQIRCTSCYRSRSRQAQICGGLCPGGADHGCPGRCANPNGKGDHQQETFATCDIAGLSPGDPAKGCEALYNFCTTYEKKPELRGKCGIGGYPSGSHHFSMGSGQSSPRAWNQCGAYSGRLKAAVGQATPTFGAPSGWNHVTNAISQLGQKFGIPDLDNFEEPEDITK